MSKPVLHYFPLRGRAEVIRLALAARNVDYDEVQVNYQDMKSDRVSYPFGQCPRFTDGDLNVVQSNTILRYLARKYDLNGATEAETVVVDMVMEAVESLRNKYVNLIYTDKLADDAKATYWSTHCAKSSMEGRNGGAHLGYLAALLAANGGSHVAGSALTMGDLALWDILDLHIRILPNLPEEYPELMTFHAAVAEVPGVKDYLASPRRPEKINGNGLG